MGLGPSRGALGLGVFWPWWGEAPGASIPAPSMPHWALIHVRTYVQSGIFLSPVFNVLQHDIVQTTQESTSEKPSKEFKHSLAQAGKLNSES